MKQRLYSILILFFMIGSLYASESALLGDWKGSGCESYNDSTSFGTYNWNFTSTTVNTYIQYHSSFPCNDPTFQSNATNGTYQLEKNNDGYSDYTLTIQLTHRSDPLVLNVLKRGDSVLLINARTGKTYASLTKQ